ncbi:unnamed protein product, partial [Allacma fusca]
NLTAEEIDELKTLLPAALVTVWVLLLAILSFVMGIVLLRGSLSRNTRLITWPQAGALQKHRNMTENQICCCGPSVWVKIIAWFQMIGSVLLIIENSLVLVATKEQLENADDAKNPRTGEKLRPYETDELKAALSAVMVVTVLKLVLAALSFVMGIVLLHGALSRNICLIRAWMA